MIVPGRSIRIAGCVLLHFLLAAFPATTRLGLAQAVTTPPAASASSLTLDTEAVAPQRFIAVHGRQSSIDGYASESLEVWAYPFQIIRGYAIAFRVEGTASAIPGAEVLRRVVYTPNSITRVYLGPEFVVHETLTVPLDRPGAVFTYQVQSKHRVEIEVHAKPVLDLMWPAGLGGQSVSWSSALSAYILSEPANHYRALVGSPDVTAHDDVENSTVHGVADAGLGLTLHTNETGVARVYVALESSKDGDTGARFNSLIRDRSALEAESVSDYDDHAKHVIQIDTPDERVNQALAWSQIALEQAWVCNSQLGCGFVAGYGPSRGARRPQYNWFFAGDGLIATDASISSGDFDRARLELEFILRYQDQKSGMIWHEMSQSAGFLDWAGKYPYMFVHVDITFQFLGTLAEYVTASGDINFARDHWKSIQAAYEYCRSLASPSDGLPRIPADKEGGDEQDRPSDDLPLSASWVEAASSFARLATLTGHAPLAREALQAEQQARTSISKRYWDQKQNIWISSHTSSGEAIVDRRSPPSESFALHLFSSTQNELMLNQLSSSGFQTDWGTRSIGAGSASFDPESYSKGSVSAAHTSGVALAFWSEHRPAPAFEMWSALLPWITLDSLGHMHEVVAGDIYRPQIESVPEQTWSTAAFLSAAVHGLLGLQVDSIARHLFFAPHLPPTWDHVSIANLHLADASIAISLHRSEAGLRLTIINPSKAFQLDFSPEIPLGAQLGQAVFNGKPVAVTAEVHPQELDAMLKLEVPAGKSELQLNFQGGVSVVAVPPTPIIGEAGSGLHIVGVGLDNSVFTIEADVPSRTNSSLQIVAPGGIEQVDGASVYPISADVYELTFAAHGDLASGDEYRRAKAVVRLKSMRK